MAVGLDIPFDGSLTLDAVSGLDDLCRHSTPFGDLYHAARLQVVDGEIGLDEKVFDLDCLVAAGAGRAHGARGNIEFLPTKVTPDGFACSRFGLRFRHEDP